jgi:hypothetical protein
MDLLADRLEIPTTSKKNGLLYLFLFHGYCVVDRAAMVYIRIKNCLSRLLAAKLFVEETQTLGK